MLEAVADPARLARSYKTAVSLLLSMARIWRFTSYCDG
jgi:hypothetical protein